MDVQARIERRRTKLTKMNFTIIIERDEDGVYVASVPALQGCHSQALSLEELYPRIREAIALCLEVNAEADIVQNEFIGVQQLEVIV